MKMCELTAELLPALAENMLGAAQANEVRAHLSTCAECAESWKTQELISRHFRETDLAADRPDYFWTKQRKHILDEVGLGTSRFEQAAPPRGGLVRFALVAAAAVLVAVGAYAMLKPSGAPEGSGGVVKNVPPKTNDDPIVQDPPKPAPEAPKDQPKEELVQDPPKEEAQPPVEDKVVEKPVPAPDPKKEEPKKDLVQEPKPKPDNTTPPKAPPNETPAAPKTEELAILPGHPKFALRLAAEQADVLIPVSADTKSPLIKDLATTEQALAFLKAGGARLDDMKAMYKLDPKADLTEMVDAYAILVGDSAAKILIFIAADGRSALGTRAELRSQQAALANFPEPLQKGVLAPAIQACAAAIDLKFRTHKPAARGPETGALAVAKESAHLLSAGGAGVVKRSSIGLAFSARYVGSILDHAKFGRPAIAEGEYLAYQRMVEAVVRMLEWLEPKDQGGMCARAKVDLAGYITQFKKFKGPEPLKALMDDAVLWTSNMIAHVSKVEAFFQGKVKDFPKRDPPPPSKEPPPSAPPPATPPAPPFGEKPPDPPPPPPPQPPFGEQP